jgi:hypothetical protein
MGKMEVKYVCDKCGYGKKLTNLEKFKKGILKGIVTFFFSIGVLFIIYLLLVGINRPLNDVLNGRYNLLAKNLDEEIRLLTLNITKDCDNSNSFCYANAIYNNVSNGSRYVLSSQNSLAGIYDPLYVYKHGGSCKDFSNMVVAFMRSVGFTAYSDCSFDKKHCIAVIPYTDNNQYLGLKVIIDLTGPLYVILTENQDNWDYMDIYESGSNQIFHKFWLN